jgi:CheY-like chemotaxis protein
VWFPFGIDGALDRSLYTRGEYSAQAETHSSPTRRPAADARRRLTMDARKRVLLVETDPGFLSLLEQVAGPLSDVDAFDDFQSARNALMAGGYDLILTNIRLGAHNGLHLMYLARAAGFPARIVAYSDPIDPLLAREVQRSGGFYEAMIRLPYSLPAYVAGELPQQDRREPAIVDRRRSYRGGRRRSDVPLSGAVRLVQV